jgi:hypothetical protein
MQVKTTDVTEADLKSAQLFFAALAGFYDLSKVTALDAFARNGQLTVSQYHHLVKELDLWELGEEHRAALVKFKPRFLNIGCSYKTLDECLRQYGLIVIDTPQGLHGDHTGRVHAEHFDMLPRITPIMADTCLVVLYVNKRPYNKDTAGEHGYDVYKEYDFDEWMRARKKFYGSEEITEAQAIAAYTRAFANCGKTVKNVVTVPCYSDVIDREPYAFRLGLELIG